jgi:hypothetical protein
VSALKWSTPGTIISASYDHTILVFGVAKEKT